MPIPEKYDALLHFFLQDTADDIGAVAAAATSYGVIVPENCQLVAVFMAAMDAAIDAGGAINILVNGVDTTEDLTYTTAAAAASQKLGFPQEGPELAAGDVLQLDCDGATTTTPFARYTYVLRRL